MNVTSAVNSHALLGLEKRSYSHQFRLSELVASQRHIIT